MLLNYYVLTETTPNMPGKKARTVKTECKGSFASSLDDSYIPEINKLIKYLLDNYYITITPDDYKNSSEFYLRNNNDEKNVYTVLDGVSHSKIDANNLKIEDALSILCSECKIPEEKIPTCIKELHPEFDKKSSIASMVSSAASTSTDDSNSEIPPTRKPSNR